MKFSHDHAWADRRDNGIIFIGITDFASQELGEISFIELPEVGSQIAAGDPVCSLDSLKSTSDIYSPVSGSIVKVNDILTAEDGLALLNDDPMGEGWVFQVEPSTAHEYEQLLDEQGYRELTGDQPR